MAKVIKQILTLPKDIRYRLTMAFMLATIIPLLSGIYLLSVHVSSSGFYLPWLKFLMIMCAILGVSGVLLIRSTIWKVVDIASTTDEILLALKSDLARGINVQEILRIERLVLYMDDQVRAARRSLELYREITRPIKHFKLPRQLPANYAKSKTKDMIQTSLELNKASGLIFWHNSEVSGNELSDDSFVPEWLQQIFKNASIIPEVIGRFGPGNWVCWLEGKSDEDIRIQITLFQHAVPKEIRETISNTCYSLPEDGDKLNNLF